MGLLLMLHFLLPVASTVFVVFLFAGWRIDGFAADLFCGGPILWETGDWFMGDPATVAAAVVCMTFSVVLLL